MSKQIVEQYYRDNYPNLVKRYHRSLGSTQAAEDVVQEAFTRCLRYIDRYDPSQPFENWFAIIFRNAFRDQLNIEKGIVFEELDEFNHPNESVNSDIEELKEAIEYEITQEPEEKRIALTLFFFAGYTAKEISQLTPFTANNVWVTICRFRKRFIKVYKER